MTHYQKLATLVFRIIGLFAMVQAAFGIAVAIPSFVRFAPMLLLLPIVILLAGLALYYFAPTIARFITRDFN
jgi:hypothetical protein